MFLVTDIWNAREMRRAIHPPVVCLSLYHTFSQFFHTRSNLRNTVFCIETIFKFALEFTPETFFILRTQQ
jgi:hypothetical protein